MAPALPAAAALGAAVAQRRIPTTPSLPASTLTVSDPAKGVIANDINVYGVQLAAAPTGGTLTLNANGTFTYTGVGTDRLVHLLRQRHGTAGVCSSGVTATVTLGAAPIEAASGITVHRLSVHVERGHHRSASSRRASSRADKDAAGYPLTVDAASVAAPARA